MKILKELIIIILATTIISCQSVQTRPVPLNITGAYKHVGSEITFPENVGQFQRVSIIQYEAGEKNISVGYNINNPTSAVAATVYVYPAPRILSIGSPPDVVKVAKEMAYQRHLEALKSDIMGAHPDAKLISDDEFTLNMHEQSHKGRKVNFEFAYTFGQNTQDAISQLYLFQSDTWLIKYRITYPKATAVESQAAVTELMSKLVWPIK